MIDFCIQLLRYFPQGQGWLPWVKSEVGSQVWGAFLQVTVVLLERRRLMDAEVEGDMSSCSKFNQVNADQVSQARCLNTGNSKID